METGYAMHPASASGPSPFFYYNPDPDSQHGQHGHFSTHPSERQTFSNQMPRFQHQQQQLPQAPEHTGFAQHLSAQAHAKNLFHSAISMTPSASPLMSHPKPSIV